jgi:hypothetical protein
MGIRNYVRNRKQVKADRATEQGIAGHQVAMKALGKGVKTPVDFIAGKGHVTVPSGDGWAGIEGVSGMEYKMFPGNPGPSVSKRPRKGNE